MFMAPQLGFSFPCTCIFMAPRLGFSFPCRYILSGEIPYLRRSCYPPNETENADFMGRKIMFLRWCIGCHWSNASSARIFRFVVELIYYYYYTRLKERLPNHCHRTPVCEHTQPGYTPIPQRGTFRPDRLPRTQLSAYYRT